MKDAWQPKIIAFLCHWCSYAGADKAGAAQLPTPPGVLPIRVMCSGRVEPLFILQAFARGADGVAVLACHPGDCHYKEGNCRALQRSRLLRRLLTQLGIEAERFHLEFVSAGEGDKFSRFMTEMAEVVARLGPLKSIGKSIQE